LNQRRAQIEDVGFLGDQRVVRALVPLAQVFGYATDLRSATQGRAAYNMTFAKFDVWQ
jgi:elongation factor G